MKNKSKFFPKTSFKYLDELVQEWKDEEEEEKSGESDSLEFEDARVRRRTSKH
jgi:hypothetical protein